jgi:HD-GYP domain-containing protein (c-di-GMP phosphodiesterase class II)
VSRAELLAVLSLVSDLGLGQPMQHALRQCLIAMRLGRVIGLDAGGCEAVFCTGLLGWVGCHVDDHEQARWFGDDRAVKPEMLPTHCAAANDLARGLGLGELVCRGIEQSFERWDGRGVPHGVRGNDIVTPARLVDLADVVEVYHGLGGVEAAVGVARQRSGTQFDPDLVEVFCTLAADIFEEVDETPAWGAVVNAEPSLARPFSEAELDAALEAMADFTDVKSPYTVGHSHRVADLAAAAAAGLGLCVDDVKDVRRAGLLHDLGRMGVPDTVWDKPGPLGVAEKERVRLHPYLTGRTLASSPGLAPLGAIAAQHHERLDGSGYPRGLRRDALGLPARLLGAADMYCTKTEPRPYRPALPARQAASALRAEVRAGRLDGETVEAVLLAGGHRSHRRQVTVAGLTPREIEVLRLLARGRSTKQIAQELRISRKTAAHHVEHIYAKLGVTNRALAGLFAAKHGLIQPDDSSGPGWVAGQVAGLA